MNEKKLTRLMTIGWFIYLLVLLLYTEEISNLIAHSNIFIGFMIYSFGNPLILLTFYAVWKYSKKSGKNAFKRLSAILLLTFAFDMVALPRIGLNKTAISIEAVTNLGSIGINFLSSFMPYTMAYYVWYLFLPFVFLAIALETMGFTDFIKNNKIR